MVLFQRCAFVAHGQISSLRSLAARDSAVVTSSAVPNQRPLQVVAEVGSSSRGRGFVADIDHAGALVVAVAASGRLRSNRKKRKLLLQSLCGRARHAHDSASCIARRAVASATEVASPAQTTQAADVAAPILVTGSSRGIGREFAAWLANEYGGDETPVILHGSSMVDQDNSASEVQRVDFRSEQAIDEFARSIEEQYPEGIGGIVHFASTPLDTAGMADGTAEAMAIVDVHLKALIGLVGRLVPLMRKSGKPCRIVTVSTGLALSTPSSWALPSGQQAGMYALVKSFVEQYTEALAQELSDTNITVCCARIEGTFKTELHDFTRGDQALPVADLIPALGAIWSMPAAEAHGRVIPARPPSAFKKSELTGGSVLGASVDSRFALRAAASGASEYPASFTPKAFGQLADTLGFSADCLRWYHGSSDAIMKCSTAAMGVAPALTFTSAVGPGRAPERSICVQAPTWHNAARLMKAGGEVKDVIELPYGNPWLEEDGDARFWEELEKQMAEPEPPALVYLVHPHFPTGYHTPDFTAKLTKIIDSGNADRTAFVVDQCYLGFVESEAQSAEDRKALETLALSNDTVILVRSLSKVEGLAGVRLGYTVATAKTTRQLASGIPFDGNLYISELDMAGAVAAVCSPEADKRRSDVVAYYAQERQFLTSGLTELGLQVTPSTGPFLSVRGPTRVIAEAIKQGAPVQKFECPTTARQDSTNPAFEASACILVGDRASNKRTVEIIKDTKQEGRTEVKMPELRLPADFKFPWDSDD